MCPVMASGVCRSLLCFTFKNGFCDPSKCRLKTLPWGKCFSSQLHGWVLGGDDGDDGDGGDGGGSDGGDDDDVDDGVGSFSALSVYRDPGTIYGKTGVILSTVLLRWVVLLPPFSKWGH